MFISVFFSAEWRGKRLPSRRRLKEGVKERGTRGV